MAGPPRSSTGEGWFRLATEIPLDAVDAVTAALLDAGATGLSEEYPELASGGPLTSGDPGDWSPPPPQPADDRVVLAGYLPASAVRRDTLTRLRERLAEMARHLPRLTGVQVELERVPDEDWGRRWREHYAPLDVGRRLRVRPSWFPPSGGDRLEIVIDPGLAFGTGTHTTTTGCLEALERALQRRAGAAVLDVGTGTGILAIAAVLLGAGRITAVETDPAAVDVARTNLALNGVEDRVALSRGSVEVVGKAHDVVVANLLAPLLCALARDLRRLTAPGGLLVASGLLVEQQSEVIAALDDAGFEVVDRRDDGEWVVIEAR